MSQAGKELSPEQWRRVKEVFGAAVERAPGERAAYLDAACRADDAVVRREVEALLATHRPSDGFLGAPASALASLTPKHAGLAEGQTLGPYRVVRTLGQGGMATVYLARDERHRRSVALKVLYPDLAHALGAERFLREIEVAANLSHPHILPLHDSGEADGLLYYVMPYVEGESLRDRLNRETQLPVDDALQIGREVADALAHAHGQGVIHRDIKPENILLSGGHALVADFGIARALGQSDRTQLTEAGMALGTVAYMSPEQASAASHIDGRSDLYSLACVVYEMLAGEPPFTGPTAQAIIAKRFSDPAPKVRRVRPAVPEALDEALTRALALVAADRFATAADFARALTEPAVAVAAVPAQAEKRKPRTARAALWLALAAGLAGLLVIGAIHLRGKPAESLNADLLAIAPFDVPNPELKLWHEGLVDVLSRNFDGAGSLRSVPPTVVVRRFRGRADRAAATDLGRRTGAGLVLFGALLGAGDSARLSATLLDVERDRVLGEVEVRDAAARMDRLADSLTVRLLRELGRTRRVGAVLSMSFGSTSLPALRAFLQGEQFYRRGAWDSALVHYQDAVERDSTLAPAFRRMGNVVGWQSSGGDSLSVAYQLRAGSLNHGLAPRESLLVAVDSLTAAAWSAKNDSLYYALVGRAFGTASEATRRSPNDPEAWYGLGELRHHMGRSFGVTGRQVLEAFDRSIALDSAFAPAYIHNVDLALTLDGPEAARRYVRAYLVLNPTDISAAGIRAVASILEPASDRETALRRLLDTLPAAPLGQAMITLWRFRDPEESAVRIFRAFASDRRGSRFSEPNFRQWVLGILAYRGHLHEAGEAVGIQGPVAPNAASYATSALLGVVPRETARAVFARWLTQRTDPVASFALPWWAATGDTVSLRRFIRWHEAPAQRGSHPILQAMNRYWTATAGGYLALARRDSAEALRRFTQVPDSLCAVALCLSSYLTKAELLSAHGRDREAALVLQQDPSWTDTPPVLLEVFWFLERGRVAERLNDRTLALKSFRTVAEAWPHADPELQPYVAEARAAIQRLSSEAR